MVAANGDTASKESGHVNIDDYTERFDEEPGYLNFARVGPIGRTVREEQLAMNEVLGRGRFGAIESLESQDERVREAVAALTRFRPDQIAFQPNTSTGLMQAIFGVTGTLALRHPNFQACHSPPYVRTRHSVRWSCSGSRRPTGG